MQLAATVAVEARMQLAVTVAVGARMQPAATVAVGARMQPAATFAVGVLIQSVAAGVLLHFAVAHAPPNSSPDDFPRQWVVREGQLPSSKS
jgi:hypothetical protein